MATAREFHHDSQTNQQPLSKKMRLALASLALEGIKLPPDALDDIHKLDSGEMSKEEFFKKTVQCTKS